MNSKNTDFVVHRTYSKLQLRHICHHEHQKVSCLCLIVTRCDFSIYTISIFVNFVLQTKKKTYVLPLPSTYSWQWYKRKFGYKLRLLPIVPQFWFITSGGVRRHAMIVCFQRWSKIFAVTDLKNTATCQRLRHDGWQHRTLIYQQVIESFL
jgi:hypothetical protein